MVLNSRVQCGPPWNPRGGLYLSSGVLLSRVPGPQPRLGDVTHNGGRRHSARAGDGLAIIVLIVLSARWVGIEHNVYCNRPLINGGINIFVAFIVWLLPNVELSSITCVLKRSLAVLI